MKCYGKTDIGKKRNSNQDEFLVCELPDGAVLAVVCDGMGGAKAGNVASKTAVDAICRYVERSYRIGLDYDSATDILNKAIISANIEVYDISLKTPELKGMGTTVVAAIATDDFTSIAHLGDSRAYIVGEQITQITRDHSVVQSLIESGKLTPEEARVHPRKNVITKALGIEENVFPENSRCDIGYGETLLLCSDGLTNYVDADTIKSIIDTNDKENVVDALIEKANNAGGGDNITAIIVNRTLPL